jgi:hypothetical protein
LPPEPNIKPIRLPLDDQLPALRRAMEADLPLRRAVGAESMSERDAFGRDLRGNGEDEPIDDPLEKLRGRQSNREDEPIGDPFAKLRDRNDWGWGRDEPEAEPDRAPSFRELMASHRPEPEPDSFDVLVDFARRKREGGDGGDDEQR